MIAPTFANLVAGYILACSALCSTEDVHAFSPSASLLPLVETFQGDGNPAKINSVPVVDSHLTYTPPTASFAPLFQSRTRNNPLLMLQDIPNSGIERESSVVTLSQRHREFCRLKSVVARTFSGWLRRSVVTIALFLTVFFTVLPPAMAAGSSGRMGGSFGSSHKNPGRTSGQSTTRVYSSPPPGRTFRPEYYSPSAWSRGAGRPYRVLSMPRGYHHHIHHRLHHHHPHPKTREESTTTTITKQKGTTVIARQESRYTDKLPFSLSDVILVTGAASWVVYGISKHHQHRDTDYSGPDSPLGLGFSVLSLTACLNVLDRNDPSSILQRLSHLAQSSDTSNRKGLQDLMAESALEIARQEKFVVSVETHYEHMRTSTQAERQYNRLSERQRSKFERESLSNYGGKQSRMKPSLNSVEFDQPSATVAIVIVHLAIQGNSLRQFDDIKSRKDLKEALSRIYSDVQVEDCLIAAEVIWSPEDPSEQITMQEIYSDFPTLNTLMD
jgi:uncharacterized membrane protein